MSAFKTRYLEVMQLYLDNDEEDVLYQANQFCKEFVQEAITPEELAAMHHEVVRELTRAFPAEKALLTLDKCLAFLLEVMVGYAVLCGRGGNSWDNLNRWHEAVIHLSSSLNLFESKYKQILDTIPVGVITIDKTGTISFINNQIEEYFEIKAQDILGTKCYDSFRRGIKQNSDGTYNSLLMETLETGKTFTDVEKEYPSGLVCRESTSVIRDETGEISEVIALLQNITPRKQLEEAMMRNEKLAAVGTMAAGIVHEIRNPLTTVRGFIQLLHSELINNPKKGYLDIIIEEIDRANSILNDFLSFSKPTSLKRQKIPVFTIIEEIRLLAESEALLKDLELDFSCPAEILCVNIDKDQIKQVLLNIVKNAFDALTTHGRVTVTANLEPESDMVYIKVTDNGIGMDAMTVSKIFDPFFTTKESGTGLGMAVSYQIIRNHGGMIQVESSPGNGTTFSILLPVVTDSNN
ncbi:MAG: ATP-binding protein [Carboxydocellales bacterium]